LGHGAGMLVPDPGIRRAVTSRIALEQCRRKPAKIRP
jgi:hypothetical protein